MTRRTRYTVDFSKRLRYRLGSASTKILTSLYRRVKDLPILRERIQKEYDGMMAELESSVKPYSSDFEPHVELPTAGLDRESILTDIEAMQEREAAKWRDGFVSGAVYHGDDGHIEFLNRVYASTSQLNPLHSDLWPSGAKFEAEIVSMTARMLGADAHGLATGSDDPVCGVVSSGGTESILLAMKAYRDHARSRRGIKRPRMVVPSTAHAAFDKAARYFGIEIVHVPVSDDCRADVEATKQAVNRNTIVVVGSTPSFPHGAIDPIEDLSEIARSHGAGFHTDACLGGFVLPWAEQLGYPVPKFDFRLPGVTSISADTHKYGYAAKGTSVVLYRGLERRHFQYFTTSDWPGGLYFSPTFAGSRPGALSATCWASLLSVGKEGYLKATKAILESAAVIRSGIESIPELHVLGDPLWVIAFASEELDIYRILDAMTKRGWSLNGLHRPPCVHIAVTLRHTQSGVADRFVNDLSAAVDDVRANPHESGGMAPVYGLAATIPVRGAIDDMLTQYMDLLYRV